MKIKKLIKKLLANADWRLDNVAVYTNEVVCFGNRALLNNPKPNSFVIVFNSSKLNACIELSQNFSEDFTYEELQEMVLGRS